MKEEKLHKDTLVIHEGYDDNLHHGSLAVPLYQTSTFSFESAKQGRKSFFRVRKKARFIRDSETRQ